MIAETWPLLSDAPMIGAQLRARLVSPSVSQKLLAALDAAGGRHFLISVTHEEEGWTDQRGKGIRGETRELRSPDRGVVRYIDIACVDSAGHVAFDAFGEDLLTGLTLGHGSTSEIVARTVEKWRHFWLFGASSAISREVEIGLFGELWFLTYWLVPKLGLKRALSIWRGPEGARHDFEAPAYSIEAKTTLIQRGLVHEITGLEQLMPPKAGPLYLYSLKAREEQGAENNIYVLIDQLTRASHEARDCLADLELKLARLHVPAEQGRAEGAIQLRVQSEGLYAITPTFPALTATSFSSPLPPAIEGVRYTLNLASCDTHLLCSAPRESVWADLALPH